jgi:hypothetical protein
MPRKYLRSVETSYELDDAASNPKSPSVLDMADEIADDDFSSYDPDAFYLRATDEKGHSITPIKVNIPTNFGPAIAKVVESTDNPYRNVTDLARDAIVHALVKHLKAMAVGNSDVPTEWFQFAELDQRKHERETKIQYLKDVEDLLEVYDNDEDWLGITELTYQAEQVTFPKALRTKRDELVRKYRRRLPTWFHPSYELEG